MNKKQLRAAKKKERAKELRKYPERKQRISEKEFKRLKRIADNYDVRIVPTHLLLKNPHKDRSE